ncbi:MAG: hypothetical protein IKB08_05735 [Clostridia bacterium]|nr:hypothetical protein [Clostridia bacterium]
MESVFYTAYELLAQRMYSNAREELEQIDITKLSFLEKAEYEFLMGVVLFETSSTSKAISKFESCIRIAKEYCPEFNLYKPYYELSISYFSIYNADRNPTDLEKSVDYCELALDVAVNNSLVMRKSGFMVYTEESPEAYINALIHLGVLYQSKKRIDESIQILIVSKTICQHFSRLDLLGQVYDELGTSYALLEKLELAGYYFVKSVKAKEIINNTKGIELTIQKHIMFTLSNPQIQHCKEMLRFKRLIPEERI